MSKKIDKYHGYLLEPFESFKGTKLTLKEISTSNPFRSTQEINEFQVKRGGFMYVLSLKMTKAIIRILTILE